MKLYATVTSERASKGQGGNKEIVINLQAGATEREQVARIWFIPSEHIANRYELRIYDKQGMTYLQYDIPQAEKDERTICADRACNNQAHGHSWHRTEKGEKQTGECAHRLSNDQNGYCLKGCGFTK